MDGFVLFTFCINIVIILFLVNKLACLLALQSDVWALGCCVYEMTTLKHAFNGKDMNALMYKILRGKVATVSLFVFC